MNRLLTPPTAEEAANSEYHVFNCEWQMKDHKPVVTWIELEYPVYCSNKLTNAELACREYADDIGAMYVVYQPRTKLYLYFA